MDFTEALVRAWRVFRADRGLWVLGALTALFGQGEFSGSFSGSGQTTTPGAPGADPEIPPFFESQQFQDLIANPIPLIVAILAVSTAISLVLAVIGIWMKCSLVHRTSVAADEQRPPVGASIRRGGERLLKSLLLELTLGLPSILIAVAAIIFGVTFFVQALGAINEDSAPDGMIATAIGGLVCFLPLLLVGLIFGLVVSVLEPFALRSCVLDATGVRASIRRSWQLVRSHLAITLVNWFILGALAVIVGLAISVPALILLASSAGDIFTSGIGSFALALGGLVIYSIVVSTTVGGALTGYRAMVYTELYRAFQTHDVAPLPASSTVL